MNENNKKIMKDDNKRNVKIKRSTKEIMEKDIRDITEEDILNCGKKGKAIKEFLIKFVQDEYAMKILEEKENEIRRLKEQRKKNNRICYKCREKGHYSKECKNKVKKD
jgi:hypothetical protein